MDISILQLFIVDVQLELCGAHETGPYWAHPAGSTSPRSMPRSHHKSLPTKNVSERKKLFEGIRIEGLDLSAAGIRYSTKNSSCDVYDWRPNLSTRPTIGIDGRLLGNRCLALNSRPSAIKQRRLLGLPVCNFSSFLKIKNILGECATHRPHTPVLLPTSTSEHLKIGEGRR